MIYLEKPAEKLIPNPPECLFSEKSDISFLDLDTYDFDFEPQWLNYTAHHGVQEIHP